MPQNSKRQSKRANRDNFYVFPIQSWDWDYSFGIRDFLPKPLLSSAAARPLSLHQAAGQGFGLAGHGLGWLDDPVSNCASG